MADRVSDRIIGIDLGTTYSVVAILDEATCEPVVIPNAEGSNTTPSIVAFTESGEVLVGEIARRQIATNPTCTVSSVKRLMGKYYSDIEESGEQFPFAVTHEDDQILINIRGIGYTPQQISALILKKLKDSAEEYLGHPATKAIITVPANFDDLQREATIEAGRLAGLEVERLVNEPTAAAMAYGLGKEKEEIVAVYDFGGGTFDNSILEVARNAFEVRTTKGDSHLGGEDIDQLIVDVLVKEFLERHGVNLMSEPLTARRLKDAAEKAKCELSTTEQTLISIPFVAYKGNLPLHLERRLARDEFEEMIRPVVNRTIDCCREALRDAGLNKSGIDKVILVGGSSRIPLVQDAVAEFFDIEPFKGVNPDEIVALGAATQGGVMAGQLREVVLLEVTPHSLGIEVKDNQVSWIIEKNSTIPIKASKMFTTTENNQEIVYIHVLQGEESEANRNRSLGRFTLSGIEPSPAGIPCIRVTFFINSDGVVEVSSTDLQSGREKSLTVAHSFLTDEQYRAGRRAASREVRTRRRRPAPAKHSPSILKGRVLGPEKTTSAVSRPTPVQPEPARNIGFKEVAPGGQPTTQQEAVTETPPEFRGARVAESVKRPPKLTSPPPAAGSGVWAPTVEAITEQAEAMSDQAELQAAAPTSVEETQGEEPIAVVYEGAPPSEAKAAAAAVEPPESINLGDRLKAECPAISEVVRRAAELIDRRVVDRRAMDEEAAGTYRQALSDCERQIAAQPDAVVLHAVAAALQIRLRNPEAANSHVESYRRARPDDSEPVLWLYSRLIERYPQYVPALRARGEIYDKLGEAERAIADFEATIVRETSDEMTLNRLEALYKAQLETAANPAFEFKLVKLYLKMSRLDEAISVLQRLVNHATYEARALKILGLCFWQKNMYYLALQKFKQLPVTDDIKDILYRLASDMEAADQLVNAKYTLERIVESDLNYKDVQNRLKGINQRLRAWQEELEKTKTPVSVEVLQDTRFVILDEINRGSMGVVYRARDKVLDEIVAIKVLNDYLCADPQAVERFKREARAAKRLSHPNIVRIHEFYESAGKKFISMEYIEGRDIKKILIEHGHLTVAEIKHYFMQMCSALQYAHELNVVHRDIKPANVMITTQDAVKITDFGIAKIMRTEDVTRSSSMIMGTPLYMSPEQIEGGQVDGRCDIYSLGIMLYEAAVGRPPFTEGNIEYHHVYTPVPKMPDHVPDALKSVILKCVEKKPENRFQTPGELLSLLNTLQG
jgi:molecular chaperone DnaK